jgi:hypothetical protein
MLDNVIVLNEQHLRRLMGEYISYRHQDPVHDSMAKDTPDVQRWHDGDPVSEADRGVCWVDHPMGPGWSVRRCARAVMKRAK